MKNPTWLLIGITILVFSAGCTSSSSSSSDNILIQPKKGSFEVIVTTTGELQAKNSVRIFGPRGGRQAGIYQMKISRMIPEGTVVSKGDFIAELDKGELMGKIAERELAFQKAESQYTQAVLDTALTLSDARDNIANLKFTMQEKQYEMKQSIYEAPATRQKIDLEYEKAERTHEQAISNYQKRIAQSVAKVKEQETDLNKERKRYNDLLSLLEQFQINAPEDGMLIYFREWNGRRRTAGSMLSPWDPVVATLPDLKQMESITFVNEIDIQKVKKGQKVELGLDAIAKKKLTGTVLTVANIGEQRPNSDSKVFEVHITINESDTTLRPAMTTSNEILVAQKEEVLHIPLECLHATDSVSFVFKKTPTGITKQEVNPGLMNDNHVEILAGILESDQVFLSMPADTSGLVFESLSTPELNAQR